MMGNVVARVLKRKHNVWDKEGDLWPWSTCYNQS